MLESKDKIIEDEGQTRHDLEEKLKKAEALAEELRNNAKFDAQRHSNEISKHKTAFIELVSNQWQLGAEMGRALRQADAAKQEINSVLEQKEQSILMTQKLSMELRRNKCLLKGKKKQAELDSERWKTTSESRNGFDQRLKNSVAVEQRHNLELDAFAEQLRLKDERLEAFRWRLLSMELELKRLQSHIEVLDHDLSQLQQDEFGCVAIESRSRITIPQAATRGIFSPP
ncbi:hypothetical protein RND71_018159 [Anisodus tanguticus]|uniref:Uncharacterized protein n=1 Tax=Anisodus tanguticus TaxID=243964 RepID=A0AAE1VAP3_9SOLA|nr:hypothetical protein RND71_018159 [Anisodus tanguticus]